MLRTESSSSLGFLHQHLVLTNRGNIEIIPHKLYHIHVFSLKPLSIAFHHIVYPVATSRAAWFVHRKSSCTSITTSEGTTLLAPIMVRSYLARLCYTSKIYHTSFTIRNLYLLKIISLAQYHYFMLNQTCTKLPPFCMPLVTATDCWATLLQLQIIMPPLHNLTLNKPGVAKLPFFTGEHAAHDSEALVLTPLSQLETEWCLTSPSPGSIVTSIYGCCRYDI